MANPGSMKIEQWGGRAKRRTHYLCLPLFLRVAIVAEFKLVFFQLDCNMLETTGCRSRPVASLWSVMPVCVPAMAAAQTKLKNFRQGTQQASQANVLPN